MTCKFLNRDEAIHEHAIESGMTPHQQDYLDPRIEGRYVIRTDPHCHILPGLDDGAPDIRMSIRMARQMTAQGIQNAIATPHGAHPGIETNVDPDFLRERVAELNAVLEDEGIPLNVFPGTEIYLRRRVVELFEQGKLLTWADQGRFILLELGFQQRSEGVLDVIDYFIAAGITPIIAHPARYLWLPDDAQMFMKLRERGCVFQFNTMSINGHFGDRIRELVLRLMPHSGTFIIGTDSHHDASRYYDFTAVKAALKSVDLLDDEGLVLPGNVQSTPALSHLAVHSRGR